MPKPLRSNDLLWLTPARGGLIVVAALMLSLGAVAVVSLVPKVINHIAKRRDRLGWLPPPDRVTAVRVSHLESDGDDATWIESDLPAERSYDVLDCFANRITDAEYWKKHPPRKGILLTPDLREVFRIELTVAGHGKVQIGGTRWGACRVGERLFVLPRPDFNRLRDIVYADRNVIDGDGASALEE